MTALHQLADVWLDMYALHMVQSSAFILLVWTIDRSVPFRARLRYGMWLIALAKLFVPPVVNLPSGVEESIPMLLPVAVMPIASASVVATAQTAPSLPTATLLFCGWAASGVVLLAVIFWQNARLQRLLSGSERVHIPEEYQPAGFGRIGSDVYALDGLRGPMLVGLHRPRLILPSGWETWPPSHLRGILSHELAHLERGDRWVLAAQLAALVLMAVNPLVWLVHRKLDYLREVICDATAVQKSGVDTLDYGKLLTGFLGRQGRPAGSLLSGTAFIEREHTIVGRLQSILSMKEADMSTLGRWSYVLLLVLCVTALPFSCAHDSVTRPVEQQPARRPAVDGIVDSLQQARMHRSWGFRYLKNKQYEDAEAQLNKALAFAPSGFELEEVPVLVHYLKNKQYEDAEAQLNKALAFAPSGFALEKVPVLVHQVPPRYPAAAREQGIGGDVFMEFVLDTDGTVEEAKVLRGHEVFREAALEAIRQWRYEPAQMHGEPVKVRMTVPVRFSLDGASEPSVFGIENHPNPFNLETVLSYSVTEPGDVEVLIYNSEGQLVRRLVQGQRSQGKHTSVWDGRDDMGRDVPSGTYTYRLQAGNRSASGRMDLKR